MNIEQIISKQISNIADHAAARQATIDKASRHAAELFASKCAEVTGLLPDAHIVSGLAGAYAKSIELSVDAMIGKVAPEVLFNDNAALKMGEGFAAYQWDQHGHNVISKSRDRASRVAEFDRKNLPSAQEAIASHGTTAAPAASMPLMDAGSALGEIERRSGKQYPSKKK